MKEESEIVSEKLFENAIASIELGVLDYESINRKNHRYLSSVRNLYAGIMLLVKYSLSLKDLSLIYRDLLPKMEGDSVAYVGKGKQTVDHKTAKDRCDALGIKIDWQKLENLHSIRNNVEHKFYDGNNNSIKKAIVDSFVIINSFFEENFKEKASNYFDENIWSIMVYESDLYVKMQKRSIDSAKRISGLNTIKAISVDLPKDMLENISCNSCGSDLICFLGEEDISLEGDLNYLDIKSIHCEVCDYLEMDVRSSFQSSLYKIFHQSRDFPDLNPKQLTRCYSCNKISFSVEHLLCFICLNRELKMTCIRCGEFVDNDSRICSKCYQSIKEINEDEY
jgi:hypothetical protein